MATVTLMTHQQCWQCTKAQLTDPPKEASYTLPQGEGDLTTHPQIHLHVSLEAQRIFLPHRLRGGDWTSLKLFSKAS